eukprot:552638-Hanusia_phi.AAC.2
MGDEVRAVVGDDEEEVDMSLRVVTANRRYAAQMLVGFGVVFESERAWKRPDGYKQYVYKCLNASNRHSLSLGHSSKYP